MIDDKMISQRRHFSVLHFFVLIVTLLGLCPLIALAHPSTNGSVTFTVTTESYGGHYADKNVGAIWVEDAQNRFVKTLKLWADKRKNHLLKWNASSGGNDVDAITSATIKTHTTHSVTWDCTDLNGTVVSDGVYTIFIEFTEDNSSKSGNPPGKSTSVQFTKGSSNQTVTPPDQTNFKNLELVYTASGGGPALALLSGTVKDANTNAALSSVLIQLQSGSQTTLQTNSDATGFFEFKDLQPATYSLTASKSGYQTYTESISLASGQQITGKAILLTPTPSNASLSGTVLDASSRQVISGATVQLENGSVIAYETTTNASGSYAFNNVAAGTYTLLSFKDGYSSWSENLVLSANQQMTGKEISLSRISNGASLSGAVLEEISRLPIAGASVQLKSGNQVSYEKQSGISGGYLFSDIAPGSYTLFVFKSGYSSSSGEITLAAGEQITGRDLLLTRAAVTDTIPPPPPQNVRIEILP